MAIHYSTIIPSKHITSAPAAAKYHVLVSFGLLKLY